jgi:beta-lactamase regulating signal transducer with metallopeptidase domain/HEAT repeat protein
MSMLEAVGWALVHFVWQGAVVALVVAVALRSMRDTSASARYALSAGALFAMILLPAATAWRLARADARPAIEAVDVVPAVAGVEPRPALITPVSRTTMGRGPVHPRSADPAGAEPTVDGIGTHAAHGARSSSRASARARVDALLPWLVAAWAIGVLLLSARLFGGWLRARRLRSRGVSPVPDACRAALARLAARLEVRRTVGLFESAFVEVPVAIGWLRPVVLLPASAFTGLTVDQLDAILAHELAHIRRHDFAVNLAQSVIETVLFYHPAVWWVSRQVRQEREHCCDDLAVAVCGDRQGYARALVGMERLRHPVPLLAVRANGGSLVMRVRRLVSPNIIQAEPAPRWVASVIALSTALTVGAAAGVPAMVTPGRSVDAPAAHGPGPAAPAAPQPSTIVRSVDPTIPFAERWAAAQRDAKTRGWSAYWLGYTVQPPAGLRGFIYSDRSATTTGHGMRFSGTFSGHVENRHFPGVSIAPLVGGGDPGRIKLLFSFAGGTASPTLSRTHASSFVLPVDLDARPLIWLGQATAVESLPIVEGLFAREANQQEKGDLVTALGLHDDSARVVPLLLKILTGTEASAVRADAAGRLGWHSVPASLAALERAARTDRASEVRREAAEAIGDLDLPEATPTLISLARTLDDREARQEAVEALGQRPEATAREALIAIARTDRDVDLQREAVETLGELKDPQAVAALTDMARTHPTVDVRREAIETLGEAMPPEQAVVFLARVARDDAHADVQCEAVETLGQVEHPSALRALVEIAGSGLKSEVRREAIETIREAMPADDAAAFLAKVAGEDGNVEVQREAVEALGELEGGRGIGEVATFALTHPVVDVRREAIETLAERAPHATAVDVLNRIVSGDRDEDVRRQALEGLAELSEGAGIPALIDVARSHPNRDLRAEALKHLVESEDPRARAVFERALAKP